jgi:hypothetical protein
MVASRRCTRRWKGWPTKTATRRSSTNSKAKPKAWKEQRKALDEALSVWPTDLMAQAGCVVHVGNNGAVAVKYGLIRPDDRSDMVQAARQAAENGTDEPLVSLPSPKTRPVHSEKLVRCLTAHRVAAVQAELLDRPDVALAAITAHLAQKIFRGNDLYYCRSENVFAISATDSQSELRSAAAQTAALARACPASCETPPAAPPDPASGDTGHRRPRTGDGTPVMPS